MQFRIKQVTYLDGNIKYVPQRRHWMYTCMLWNNFHGILGYDECGLVKFIREEDCRNFLKGYTTGMERDTIKSISFKSYP